MAGDWIKMRTNLDTDVRVLELASLLNMTELHVVGCLWKLWSWADQHTADGNAVRVTYVTLDRFTGVTGFAHAVREVGWMEGDDGCITFTRFTEHNGQTAKNRAKTKERVAKHRNAKTVTNVTLAPLPEKRREEKRRDIKKETRDVANSPYFGDAEFAAAFESFKESSRANHYWDIAETTAEAWLMDLANLPVEEATKALRYSTACGAKKPITNGDHNRKPSTNTTGGSRHGRSRVSLDEGLLQ